MDEKSKAQVDARPEQILYAKLLEIGMFLGLLTLFITFAIYAFGIVDPYIGFDEISNVWGMRVHDYLEHEHVPVGWGWFGMLNFSDFLNMIGIAMLAGVTIICYLSVVPTLWKQGDKVYTFLVIIEIVVLSLAASGVLTAGH